MKIYNLYNFAQKSRTKTVVVLGAGPSLISNEKQTIEYIKKNNSTVIGTGYNFPILSHYSLIVGKTRFKKLICENKCNNIVVTNYVLDENIKRAKNDALINNRKYFIVKTKSKKRKYYSFNQEISLDEEGRFNVWLMNCGFVALLISCFFNPEEVVVSGLDGPRISDLRKVDHFNSDSRSLNLSRKNAINTFNKKQKFLCKILNFLHKKSIKVRVFDSVFFWGIKEHEFIRRL